MDYTALTKYRAGSAAGLKSGETRIDICYILKGPWWPMELIMPLMHSDLKTWRIPLDGSQRAAGWARAIVLGTLLFSTANSSLAQGTGSVKANPLYPDEAEITFQWNYECPVNRPCTFVCRGAG